MTIVNYDTPSFLDAFNRSFVCLQQIIALFSEEPSASLIELSPCSQRSLWERTTDGWLVLV